MVGVVSANIDGSPGVEILTLRWNLCNGPCLAEYYH
jgi:hypothetical protein